MFCPNCNEEINENTNFCPNCGEKIKKEELHNDNNEESITEHQGELTEPIKTKFKDDYLFLKIIGGIFVTVVVLWGYNYFASNNKDEPVSSITEEETYTRQITDEEQKYIDLILDKDYETVIEKTRDIDSEVTNDYYRIARALLQYRDVNENSKNLDDFELESEYSNIVNNLEQVKYIPKKLQEQVKNVKDISIEEEAYYRDLNAEERAYNEQQAFEDEVDARTLNPQNVSIGMTQEEVLTDGWGRPNDINKTTNTYGTSEQWVYDSYLVSGYLYFEDGILTSIQN